MSQFGTIMRELMPKWMWRKEPLQGSRRGLAASGERADEDWRRCEEGDPNGATPDDADLCAHQDDRMRH